MLRNYIKIALRNLLKSRIYTFINVIGLSVGIAGFLLIAMHVEDELSYDKFHTKSDRVYKFVLERLYPDHITRYAITPHSFSEVLVRDFPEVKNAVRIFGGGGNNAVIVRYLDESGEEKVFEETRFIAADSTFFDLFSFKLVAGDTENVLKKPQSMVITQAMATKYFGDGEPVSKILKTDFGEFTVTGVVENVPENSHMEFDFVTSMTSIPFIFQNENFTSFSTHIYLELESGAHPGALEAKFPRIVERYAAPQIEQNLNTSYEQYVAAGNGYNYSLISLEDVHLHPVEYQSEFKPGGDINDVYIFVSIALLILIIACINFMNLATARSTERAREVGIRKTLGSPRKQLIGQFLTESVLLSLFATLISLGLVYLALPYFNILAEKGLELNLKSWSVALIFIFGTAVGLLAGAYPAFVLSGFNPVSVMKGKLQTNRTGNWLRNGLVVFQFSISIFLIAGTLIVQEQMTFIKNKDLGYQKERLLVIERAGVLDAQQKAFMDELRKLPAVEAVGGSGTLPVNRFFGVQFMPAGASEVLTVNAMQLDDHYITTMGFEIIQGRGFSEDFNDSLSVVINEQTAELLDVDPEDVIGMKLTNTIPGDPPVILEFEVVGVVKSFHYMTLKDMISPFVLMSNENGLPNVPFISVRVKSDRLQEALAAVESKWSEFAPQEPLKYKFLDQELNELYKTEANSGKVFAVFAALAIIIACVGLFGLAAYMAGLRTKEIGVRKVMGASVIAIVLLLSKDFTKLIFLALVIAIPLCWFFMSRWLEGFAYRTTIGADTFIIAGLAAVLIAWITVSYQSVKAAIVNPVKSLRNE
ncbi:ABC transporter permease [Fulvivirga imtechensis]|nr:ABC transporter permease [Fulvivirga imtechensis]